MNRKLAIGIVGLITVLMFALSMIGAYRIGYRNCEVQRDKEILEYGSITVMTRDGRVRFIDADGKEIGSVDLSASDEQSIIVRIINLQR